MAPGLRNPGPMLSFRRIGLALVLATAAACSAPPRAQEADELLARGDYDGAVVRYALALAENPGDEELARKLEEARSLAWSTYRERAAAAISRSDFGTAEDLLKRVVELDPGDREAHRRLREIESERGDVTTAVTEAERLLGTGDPAGAVRILAPYRRRFQTLPKGLEVLREAERSLREKEIRRASDALAREDPAEALAAARRAQAVLPVDPRATRLVARAEALHEAVVLATGAKEALGRGDYRGAIAGYRKALALHGGLTNAELGLRSARAAGARANLEAAARAAAEGRQAEALERLETARQLDPDAASRMPLEAEIRDGLAGDLLTRGKAHLAGDRPALGLLHLDRAREIREDLPGLAEALEEAHAAVHGALRVGVRIQDLRNRTGAPVDTLGIGRAATAHMLSDGVLGWVEIVSGEGDGETVDVEVSGIVTTYRVQRSKPITRARSVRYVKQFVRVPNPDYVELEEDFRAAERVEREASFRLGDERRRLLVLEQNPWDAWHLDRRSGGGTASNRGGRDPGQVRAAYASALLIQRTRIRRAERSWNDAVDEITELRDLMSRTSPNLEKPIHATHRYEERVQTLSGRAVVDLTLTSLADRSTLAREEAYAGFSREDTRSAGFEPAGLAPDGDDLASDEDAFEDLADDLVARIAGRTRDALESLALRHLEGMDALADEAARHERWARFLLTGFRGPKGTRDELRRKLRDATGLAVPALPSSIQTSPPEEAR